MTSESNEKETDTYILIEKPKTCGVTNVSLILAFVIEIYSKYYSCMSAITNKAAKQVSPDGYFLQQHQLCIKALRNYARKKDIETLHQLRVPIKKINAILLMLHKLQDDFDFEKVYAPYKNIFKQSGVIRELLLHQQKILADTKSKRLKAVNPRTIPALNQKLSFATPSFIKETTGNLAAIQICLEQLKGKQIFSYCKNLKIKLKRKWKKSAKSIEIHGFRKHLKQVLYCTDLLSKKKRDKILPPKKHKQIDKLQDTIGQWHDNILLLNKISKDKLEVSAQFLQSLHSETKEMLDKIFRKGNKL